MSEIKATGNKPAPPLVKPSPHQQLQQYYWRSGIAYFESGKRLFDLVYILLMISVILSVICLVTAFIATLLGAAWLGALLNTLARLLPR